MAVKIITMEIVSKKSGKAIEVSFPMDEGLFKASFSLPKKKRILFLTEAYHEFNYEEKRKRRLLFLESMLEDCTEFEDGLVDDSLNPEEQCLRNERDVLLYDAISKLNERQRKVIVELFLQWEDSETIGRGNGHYRAGNIHVCCICLSKAKRLP